ncbi:MAG: hypothetical protein A3F04_01300 [Candidatus Chisholmbacteria bacterium RIFCSPHIGHO2_12_FULL_49_9]|uniref:Uncharacterized protein n=1 Tax=Candidatus Chisholmbacteria bacterium RIFCSPHIGHO2_01_FULL_52_32 TaxID=1797591 RepID=A0A1G1VTK6_9BACT|nr:MAG: hypothetical protein A2786_04515 [Candidatus Chisholmbacteria bacterium RIFCSPHIGHO2_01_FULL_52_32]OGY19901.1 MAG: hypothetical protein A2900_02230 [Candidatus Chisholmbacteria bacterium RIFCSPLOWO2_01_FULL_50_28]OGY21256.1 MAG: hypothetical protein A3F04_01300 [Candidatus Chisholmbacteria bacterium RIFCSPHIGHO2_12_FULL_49_9]
MTLLPLFQLRIVLHLGGAILKLAPWRLLLHWGHLGIFYPHFSLQLRPATNSIPYNFNESIH